MVITMLCFMLDGNQMQAVDPDGALKMYMEAEEWDKCLDLAQKQVSTHVYTSYVTRYPSFYNVLLC